METYRVIIYHAPGLHVTAIWIDSDFLLHALTSPPGLAFQDAWKIILKIKGKGILNQN